MADTFWRAANAHGSGFIGAWVAGFAFVRSACSHELALSSQTRGSAPEKEPSPRHYSLRSRQPYGMKYIGFGTLYVLSAYPPDKSLYWSPKLATIR